MNYQLLFLCIFVLLSAVHLSQLQESDDGDDEELIADLFKFKPDNIQGAVGGQRDKKSGDGNGLNDDDNEGALSRDKKSKKVYNIDDNDPIQDVKNVIKEDEDEDDHQAVQRIVKSSGSGDKKPDVAVIKVEENIEIEPDPRIKKSHGRSNYYSDGGSGGGSKLSKSRSFGDESAMLAASVPAPNGIDFATYKDPVLKHQDWDKFNYTANHNNKKGPCDDFTRISPFKNFTLHYGKDDKIENKHTCFLGVGSNCEGVRRGSKLKCVPHSKCAWSRKRRLIVRECFCNFGFTLTTKLGCQLDDE